MEYADAIGDNTAEQAFTIALDRLSCGSSDLHEIAVEAVRLAYCTCVTDGEDAAERQLSKIHAELISAVEQRLSRYLGSPHHQTQAGEIIC